MGLSNKVLGFRAGYRRYIAARDPEAVQLPDCPWPLRTAERSEWLAAHAAGMRLARRHRLEQATAEGAL